MVLWPVNADDSRTCVGPTVMQDLLGGAELGCTLPPYVTHNVKLMGGFKCLHNDKHVYNSVCNGIKDNEYDIFFFFFFFSFIEFVPESLDTFL